MKKIKDIALWVSILIYLFVALGFVSEKRYALVCNKIAINVTDSLRNDFVERKQIIRLLEKNGINLIGQRFKDINLKKVEQIVNDYPPVYKAEVYKTINGTVNIDIEQRRPIVRVMDSRNLNYYIDEDGYIMRTSQNYTSHVIIVNGNINTNFILSNRVNVLEQEKSSQGKTKLLADIYRLGKYITDDKFWDAQIQQIYVNSSGDFELIPRIGDQNIIFGDYSDCETKFNNLMSLYKNAFPVVGWDKYKTINLKFKGQVVCTKRD
jgi:cell division protein FtsQ